VLVNDFLFQEIVPVLTRSST
jgi:hypothetical protein